VQTTTLTATLPPPPPPPRRSPATGWVLLAPAVVLLVLCYVWPTLRMLIESFSGKGGWGYVFSAAGGRALGNQVLYVLIPLGIVALVAPPLAWAASRAGRLPRRAVRIALALPLAAVAPTALALVWIGGRPRSADPANPTHWHGWLVLPATMGVLVLAVAVTCYLAALRGPRPRAAMWAVGGVLGLVTIGLALQQYTFGHIVDGATGNDSGHGLLSDAISDRGGLDPVTAALGLSVAVLLAVLGLAVTVVVRRTDLRVDVAGDPAPADLAGAGRRRGLALAGVALLFAGTVVLIVLQTGPWLAAMFGRQVPIPPQFSAFSVFFNTWGLTLLTALIEVGVGLLAAIGIVVFRPIGPRSEALLFAFAPWLLFGNWLIELTRVSDKTLSVSQFLAPTWLSIPALFLFVVLLRGQAGRGRIFAALVPMFVLAVGVVWLVQAQDLFTPTLADGGHGALGNGPLLAGHSALLMYAPHANVSVAYPFFMLVLFTLGALVLQLAYLDRVTVRAGTAAR
jgi:hypothetical protein